jgi:hypothetical protein
MEPELEPGDDIERRRPKRHPGWAWLISVAVVAVLVASTFSVVYVNRVVHQMCGLIALLADDNPRPATARGMDLLREAKRLQREYGCT